MNTFKKSIAILLSVLMLVSVMAVAGFSASAEDTATVYFNPADVADTETLDFYAWIWADGAPAEDFAPVTADEESGYYTVPAKVGQNIIFLSVPKGEAPASNWSNVDHQTGDLTFDGTNNLFTLTGFNTTVDQFGNEKEFYDGAWSVYEAPVVSEPTTTEPATSEPATDPLATEATPSEAPTQPTTQEPTEATPSEAVPTDAPTEPVTDAPTEPPTLPSEKPFYVVAGAPELCNGVSWDPSSALNLMTLDENGIYSITYTNVPAGTHDFKVTTDGAWDNGDYNLTGDAKFGGPNAQVTVAEDGATVKITFNPAVMHANAYVNGEYVDVGATLPATTEPVTTEPVTTEPASTEPASTEPATTEPATTVETQPTTTEPATQAPTVKKAAPKKANTVTVKASKKAKLTVKAKKLKKATQTVKAFTVSKAKGKVTVTVVKKGTDKKLYKKLTVKKNGKLTIKKGKYKKGTYKVKLKVKAAGTKTYKSKAKTITVKIRIK